MSWRATAAGVLAVACGCTFEVIDIRLAATDAAVPDAPTVDAPAVDTPAPDASFVGQRSCIPTVAGCGQARIDGGTFAMGDPMAYDSRGSGNRAVPVQDRITVGSFMLDQYEVTVARFNAFWRARMADGGASIRSRPLSYPRGQTIAWDSAGQEPISVNLNSYCNWTTSGARDDHPINCVDWWTAQEFCAWDTDGGRLPSEAEWEYAARGSMNRPWPWEGPDSAMPDRRVCWNRSSPTPLGTCLEDDSAFASGSTPEGVRHLVGNVWEWTADWYASYSDTICWDNQARMDPSCMSSASGIRSMRGGSWDISDASDVRSGTRDVGQPTLRVNVVGFRCAGPVR